MTIMPGRSDATACGPSASGVYGKGNGPVSYAVSKYDAFHDDG